MRHLVPITLIFVLAGCAGDGPVEPAHDSSVEPDAIRESMMQSNAPFALWYQGFETGTEGWVTDDVAGPAGWCGDIEVVRDASMASAGRSFAVVSFGSCNAFWQNNGFSASGPSGLGAGILMPFPRGGYVMELDIYLDPSWTAGNGFTLAVSLYLLDRPFPQGFRYVMVPVTADGVGLHVAGRPVDDAGWYTFRYRVGSDGGQLALEFELADHGQTLFSMPLATTAFTGEDTDSFTASNVGSGYFWFAAIADGLDLPIDEHRVRRGR